MGMNRHKRAGKPGKGCNKVARAETARSTPLNPDKLPQDLVELKLCLSFLVKNMQSMSTTL